MGCGQQSNRAIENSSKASATIESTLRSCFLRQKIWEDFFFFNFGQGIGFGVDEHM